MKGFCGICNSLIPNKNKWCPKHREEGKRLAHEIYRESIRNGRERVKAGRFVDGYPMMFLDNRLPRDEGATSANGRGSKSPRQRIIEHLRAIGYTNY